MLCGDLTKPQRIVLVTLPSALVTYSKKYLTAYIKFS